MSTPSLPAGLPAGLSIDDVMDAMERRMTGLDNPGFCLACGAEADGVEPDARGYRCESCGERRVHGAEDIFIAYL